MSAPESIWAYDPNLPLAAASTGLYGILFGIITYQTVFRYRAWFFLAVVVGAAIEVIGYTMRVYSAKNQREIVPLPLSSPIVTAS